MVDAININSVFSSGINIDNKSSVINSINKCLFVFILNSFFIVSFK